MLSNSFYMIEQFQGEYRWLSNFAPVKIILDGIEYASVEHAYMSAKSNGMVSYILDGKLYIIPWKEYCANSNNTAGQVKKASKDIELIDGWNEKKYDVMKECIKQKFNQEPYKTKLLETTTFIQEGNTWGDVFWGVCLKTNEGENHLGKLIMSIRQYLKLKAIWND